MSIKRCPYCKAIVEEDSGFCSNCGTRLLFPEDEFKDEEIPGDKIAEEEELPSGQPEEVETDEGGSQEEEREEEEMKPKEGRQEKTADSEETEKKEIEKFLESLKKERAEKAKQIVSETLEEMPPGRPEKVDKVQEIPLETEKEKKKEEIKREAPSKSGEMEFKTEELDQIPDARTKEKEDIERFLASLREEAAKAPSPREEAPPAPQKKREEVPESLEEKIPHETPGKIDTDEQLFIRKEIEEKLKAGFKAAVAEEMPDAKEKGKEEIDRFLESVKKERAEKAGTREEEVPPTQEKISEGTAEIGEKLPPWAERVQKGTSFKVEVEEEKEAAPELGRELQEAEEEVEGEVIEEEPPLSEKEAEFKKRVEQVGLPFEGEIEEEGEAKKQAPSRLSVWLKSRAFDLLSIAVLWIISIWLASRLMEVSLFKLISVSALPSLAFYLVLLVVYFSFFMLLLGETLGDLIFSREE